MSGFVRQYTGLLGDWMVGAFSAATLDMFFGVWTTDSHVLNTLSAILQFTLEIYATAELLTAFGFRRPNNTIQNTWLMGVILWEMSPKAVRKLKNSYYAFHRFLYGQRSRPTMPNGSRPGQGTGGTTGGGITLPNAGANLPNQGANLPTEVR